MATVKVKKIVRRFNQRYPVGTRIRYWTGLKNYGPGAETTTRTPAEILGGHTPVVWVDGHAACIALTHVEPIDQSSHFEVDVG